MFFLNPLYKNVVYMLNLVLYVKYSPKKRGNMICESDYRHIADFTDQYFQEYIIFISMTNNIFLTWMLF